MRPAHTDPTSTPNEHRQGTSDSRQAADAFVLAADRLGPVHRLPRRVRVVLPSPTVSDREWLRFTHRDLDQFSPGQAAAEAFRLRMAVAAVEDPDEVPWIRDRLTALDQRSAQS